MWICYIDEAGCTGMQPTATSIIQPVFVLAGIIVDQTRLQQLTLDFLALLQRFFLGLTLDGATPATRLDWVLPEIKGASFRSSVQSASRNRRRQTLGFLDRILDLLEHYQIRLTGRLIVKGIGTPIDGTALYTSAIQSVCEVMHHWLTVVNDEGVIIADSRSSDEPGWEPRTRNGKREQASWTDAANQIDPYPNRVCRLPPRLPQPLHPP